MIKITQERTYTLEHNMVEYFVIGVLFLM